MPMCVTYTDPVGTTESSIYTLEWPEVKSADVTIHFARGHHETFNLHPGMGG